VTRSPAPEEALDIAKPYGIGGAKPRARGDELGAEAAVEMVESRAASMRRAAAVRPLAYWPETGPIDRPIRALSGGGAHGAFDAGLLAG
jgi:hypothetical protein